MSQAATHGRAFSDPNRVGHDRGEVAVGCELE